VVYRQRGVDAFLLQDMQQQMRQFEIAVSRALGVPQRLDKGIVADAVELAGDCFEVDFSHGSPLTPARRTRSFLL
jgi:hypothetical protein